MKKTVTAICLLIIIAMMFPGSGFGASDNYDTLSDWDIRVKVPENTTAVLNGGNYYIYAGRSGSIPYVMLRAYSGYASEKEFITAFTEYMAGQYSDLEVLEDAREIMIGERTCYEIDYGYKISNYDALDRRIVINENGLTYMFASKEVKALGLTVGTLLEEVVENCEFIKSSSASDEPPEPSALPEPEDESRLAPAYLYCSKNGMPKYWLDLTGLLSDGIVLHCYFRSGDPEYYEQLYYLDTNTAVIKENSLTFKNIYDWKGRGCSNLFKTLKVSFYGDRALLYVSRNSSTLAGGADDNLLSGSYMMEALRARYVSEYHKENGDLKYWLDSDGEDMILHAMFQSGDPEYYEETFVLDTDTAEADGDYTININRVYDSGGRDVSGWFESLSLTYAQGAINMVVKRDESTLAGGAEDNILSGVYTFEPHTYLMPAEDGPYTAEELGRWAQICYFVHNGFFPPMADIERNADGSYTVHLYEVVDTDGASHTATSAWYTVDEYGYGTDDITGKTIYLFS